MSRINELFLGTECGNGFTKSCFLGKEDNYLNTLYEVEESDYNKGSLAVKVNQDEVFKVGGRYFKVGKKPLSKEYITFNSTDKNKYFKEEFKAAFLISLFRQLRAVRDFSTCNIYVVTGVPTEHAEDDQLRDEISKFYEKTHTVNDQTIRIKGLEVIAQGEAAFYSEVYRQGKENAEYILETTPKIEGTEFNIMYVDLGHKTCDYRLINDYSVRGGAEIEGMEDIWTQLIKMAQKQNRALIGFSPLLLEEQLREGGEIDIEDETADVTVERDAILSKYAERILDRLKMGEFAEKRLHSIRFCGGGSLALRPYLEKKIAETHKENPKLINRYKFLENPQTRNAVGYLEACYQIFQD